MTHEAFLNEAIHLSRLNVEQGIGGPFGAVIVRNGEIVARGANRVTTDNDPTAHAEIVAIREAGKNLDTYDLSGCVVYSSCEPCPMCLAAAYWARVDAIYFAATKEDAAAAGFDDEFLYREIPLPLDARAIPTTHWIALQPDANAIFTSWEAALNKTPY
jgi:guanine deaminase